MSKTDHARLPGTHRVGHDGRRWRKDDGESLAQRAVATREVIDEGLAEYHAPLDLGETYVRECSDGFDDQWHDGDDLRMADWEIALLTGIDQEEVADVVWTSLESEVIDLHERTVLVEVDEDEGYDEHYAGSWLTGTIAEAFPDGAFTIEGPATQRDRSSGKADAHMRVYELAREVGIETRHMVEFLRVVEGEWVAGQTAYVALPVCERMLDLADDLRAEYGQRATPKTWAQQRTAWDARFATRRPGLSRPLD